MSTEGILGGWGWEEEGRRCQFWVRLSGRRNVCHYPGREEREVRRCAKVSLLPKENSDSKHSQESSCPRGPKSIWLTTVWSVWGCLWPHQAWCLWDRQEDVICGVWSGQSLWCGQEWATHRAMDWTRAVLLKCQVAYSIWCRQGKSLTVSVKWTGAGGGQEQGHPSGALLRTQRGHSHIICVDGGGPHSGLVGPVSIATGDVLCGPMWSAAQWMLWYSQTLGIDKRRLLQFSLGWWGFSKVDRAQVFAVSGPDCYSNFYICLALGAIMSNTDKGYLCGSLSFYIKKTTQKKQKWFGGIFLR